MRRGSEKHIDYFAVLDAFREAKLCALCELEDRSVRMYLDSLLYESVNDAGVRANLVRSRGYCRRHAHLLLEFANGLGTAILYLDQVRQYLQFLEGLRGPDAKLRRKKEQEWNHHALCPACAIQAQSRRGQVGTLLAWLDDPEMREAFEQSPGLCVPHLLFVLDQAEDTDQRDYLIAVQTRMFSTLADELAEYCRKHDYRFLADGFGKEGDSWQRAVNMMVGINGGF